MRINPTLAVLPLQPNVSTAATSTINPVRRRSYVNRLWKVALTLAFAITLAQSSFAQLIMPQGRLTLASNTPVMTSDALNATTVYYTPYQGNTVPYYNGSAYVPSVFSQLQLNLSSSTQLQGEIYDLFINYGNPGGGSNRLFLCAGPAWSSLTSRGSAALLTMQNGLWVNNAAISCYNQAATVSAPAGTVDYVGSIYMTGNGETSMQFKPMPATGGTSNVLGVYNAYNRVRTISRNIDSVTHGWTDTTVGWELLDTANSTSANQNIISFLDGMPPAGNSSIDAQVQVNILTSSASVVGFDAVSEDSTAPTNPGGTEGISNSTQTPFGFVGVAFDHFQPQLGLHYVAAIEYSTGSTVTFLNGSGTAEELKVELEM